MWGSDPEAVPSTTPRSTHIRRRKTSKWEPVHPKRAFFHEGCGAFSPPYDAMWEAYDPDRALLDFFQSTYPAAATGGWDHGAPEREGGACGFRVHALDCRFSGA